MKKSNPLINDLTEQEIEIIQQNYQKQITKHSNYYYSGLGSSILNKNIKVWCPWNSLSKLGCLCGIEHSNILFITHFAPTSTKAGYELLLDALNSNQKMIFAVTSWLANQLEKMGFVFHGYCKQLFNNNEVIKCVFSNKSPEWTDEEKQLIDMTLSPTIENSTLLNIENLQMKESNPRKPKPETYETKMVLLNMCYAGKPRPARNTHLFSLLMSYVSNDDEFSEKLKLINEEVGNNWFGHYTKEGVAKTKKATNPMENNPRKDVSKKFVEQGASENEVEKYLDLFDVARKENRIKEIDNRNIDNWGKKPFGEFKKFVEGLKTHREIGTSGAKLVAENAHWKVLKIETHEAAKQYGTHKWCITQDDGRYWIRYTKHANFYFILPKFETDPDWQWRKIAVQASHFKTTYWDAYDVSHAELPKDLYIPEFEMERPPATFKVIVSDETLELTLEEYHSLKECWGNFVIVEKAIEEMPRNLREIGGNLFINETQIKKLSNITVLGDVVAHNSVLETIENVVIGGKLEIVSCQTLYGLGDKVVTLHLYIDNCQKFTKLPDNLYIMGDVFLNGLTSLTYIPKMKINGEFRVQNCPLLGQIDTIDCSESRSAAILSNMYSLSSIGMNSKFNILRISDCSLQYLPANLHVKNSLYLRELPIREITEKGIARVHTLSLQNLPRLTDFPNHLYNLEVLFISDCTNLRNFPDTLTVNGKCRIEDCPNFESLPKKRFEVSGELIIKFCSSFKILPETLICERLVIHNCALKTIPDEALRYVKKANIDGQEYRQEYLDKIHKKENPMKNRKWLRNNPMTLEAHGTDERPDANYDPKELMRGIYVEREDKHTTRLEIAKKIAKDHLDEDPRYYSKLATIEKPYHPPAVKTKRFFTHGIPKFQMQENPFEPEVYSKPFDIPPGEEELFSYMQKLPDGTKQPLFEIFSMKDGADIMDDVYLENSKIPFWPDTVRYVEGNVYLAYSEIKRLPEGFIVAGTLDLQGSSIEELPKGLMAHTLVIRDTNITKLPDNMEVGTVILQDNNITEIGDIYEYESTKFMGTGKVLGVELKPPVSIIYGRDLNRLKKSNPKKRNPSPEKAMNTVESYIKNTFSKVKEVNLGQGYGYKGFHVEEQWRYVATQFSRKFGCIKQLIGAINESEYHVAKIGPQIIVHLRITRDLTVAIYNPEAAREHLGDVASPTGTLIALMPLSDHDWENGKEHFSKATFTSIESNPKHKNPTFVMFVQSLLFDKKLFTKKKAQEWCKKHNYIHTAVDETKNNYRIRQIEPKKIQKGTFRTVEFGQGIKAILGGVKGKKPKRANPIPTPGTKAWDEWNREQMEETRFMQKHGHLDVTKQQEELEKFRASRKPKAILPAISEVESPKEPETPLSTPNETEAETPSTTAITTPVRFGYLFQNKDEQIQALTEFIDDVGKWAYEYETEHEDAGGNYIDIAMNSFGSIEDINSSSVRKVAEKLRDKLFVDEDKIVDWITNNGTIESGTMRIPRGGIQGISCGEIETQLSGMSGLVNGVKVDDVFEALCQGLTTDELETAGKHSDYYWEPKKYGYWMTNKINDLVYTNCEDSWWWWCVDEDKMVEELVDDDHLVKWLRPAYQRKWRYQLAGDSATANDIQDAIDEFVEAYEDVSPYIYDLTIEDEAEKLAREENSKGSPLPVSEAFPKSKNPVRIKLNLSKGDE